MTETEARLWRENKALQELNATQEIEINNLRKWLEDDKLLVKSLMAKNGDCWDQINRLNEDIRRNRSWALNQDCVENFK